MESVANQISDSTILTLIRENNLKGWEQLYDKYGPVMYGIICAHTSDKGLAEEIFIKLFISLKQEEIPLKFNLALRICLLRYTHLNTTQGLKIRGINSTEPRIRTNSILHTFCSQSITTKQVAANFKISEQEVTQNLHKDFLTLRSQNQPSQPTQEKETLKGSYGPIINHNPLFNNAKIKNFKKCRNNEALFVGLAQQD